MAVGWGVVVGIIGILMAVPEYKKIWWNHF
jgi:hypothetical protein